MTADPERFLADYPDIRGVQLFLTDPCGAVRGKTIDRSELATLYTYGRNVSGSVMGLTITGEDVADTGLVWDRGDADMLARPLPGTLKISPWLDRTGQVMLSLHDLDGSPAPADPRQALVRAAARIRDLGYTPVMACEIEFYLLRRLPDGQLVPAGPEAPLNLNERDRIDAYDLARLDDLAPVFTDVFDAARAQSLPVGTLMSEYAPGQYEITLEHRPDALQAVDEAVMFKRLLKGVAARHGLICTFMAKPFTGRSGSGAHLHLSLADAAGVNLFAAEDPAGTVLLRQVVAGLKETAAESFLVFAPNGNSYRRFRRESYAPVAATWGINNRSVSLRIPAGPPHSRHVEHRFSGADVNLYLAAAVVLAGAERGLRLKLDPGPPVVGNGYEAAVADPGARLPVTWASALQRARASGFLREALGAEFLDIFLAIKEQERAGFDYEVTNLDYQWYLRRV
ncbi:MAG TPA: glutamine synthetase family protein [Steroidobacteraceae bacterium]|nr:glutamine synthetase family protein [Steroidobacteraceae bacterium]